MKPGLLKTERAAILLLTGVLAACGSDKAEEAPVEKAAPAAKKATAAPAKKQAEDEEPVGEQGTPNEDRVATISILNKRNNLSEDFTMKTGEARRFGKAVVRLRSCDRTPQWESPPEQAAFVQVYVEERPAPGKDEEFRKVFSGWLFKNSPSLNVVQHPVYDVWVKNCAMKFPGEVSAGASSSSESKESGKKNDASDDE